MATIHLKRNASFKSVAAHVDYSQAPHAQASGFDEIGRALCSEAGVDVSKFLKGSHLSTPYAISVLKHFSQKYRHAANGLFSLRADQWIANGQGGAFAGKKDTYPTAVAVMREVLRRDSVWAIMAQLHPNLFVMGVTSSARECGAKAVSYAYSGKVAPSWDRPFGPGQINLGLHSAKLHFSGIHYRTLTDPQQGARVMSVRDCVCALVDAELRSLWGVAAHDLITGEQFYLSMLLPQFACLLGLLVKLDSYDLANASLSKRTSASYRPEDFECKSWLSTRSRTLPDSLRVSMGLAFWRPTAVQEAYRALGRYPVTTSDITSLQRVFGGEEGRAVLASLAKGPSYMTTEQTTFFS